MSTARTLVAFALGLTAVFGGAYAVGQAVGPVGVISDEPEHSYDIGDPTHGEGS